MRILHVNKFLYRRGGAEGYMEDVAGLQARAGHDVAFFGMHHPLNSYPSFTDLLVSNVEFDPPPDTLRGRLALAGRAVWSPSAARSMGEVVRRFRPDVVHLHNIYHQLSPSILWPLPRMGVPAVMTLHDYKLVCPTYQMLDHGEVCDACVGRHFHRALKRRCRNDSLPTTAMMVADLSVHTWLRAYSPVNVFVCPSRFLAQQMVAGKVYPERLRVLRHFVDLGNHVAKQSPGGDVIYAGRLSHEKGIDTLIRAMQHVGSRTVLAIAGDGPIKAELEDLAAAVAPGRVVFHGRLSKDALLGLLSSSAVAVVPSRWHENQPLAVLEAFASGVPVIATRLGGLPELVTPDVTGALVHPDDPQALARAIDDLLEAPDRAFAMGRTARELIRTDFDPGQHHEGLDRIYEEARRSRGSRRAR